MQSGGKTYVSVREAAVRMRKAPGTVRALVKAGEVEGVTVHTEAGHQRLYVALDAVEAAEAAQLAA